MKLGNLITLAIFTLFAVYMIVAGYPNESSQSLWGVVIFVICLFYWTSYLNKYRLDNKDYRNVLTKNKELTLELEHAMREQALLIEINKLANKHIENLKELIELQEDVVKVQKDSIKSRDEVIQSYDEMVKNGELSYNPPDLLEQAAEAKKPENSTIAEVMASK